MINWKTRILSAAMGILFAVLLTVPAIAAAKSTTTSMPSAAYVRNGYVDCTDAYTYLNQFRTGKDTWYWNQDRTAKIWVRNLKPLKRNKDLEQAARIRAKELVQYFGHTRPNGKRCFTVYPQSPYRGENIAKGFSNAQEMTESLKEHHSYDYWGTQGHCRNMLNKHYDSVGIACYADQYGRKHWVQAFGKMNS